MPDKRFLGLGFTFTANDKGLQKKLQSISTLVSDISDGLSDVNNQFAKMSGPKNVTVRKKTIGSTSKKSSTTGNIQCCSELIKIGNLQNFYLGQVQKSINSMHSTLKNKSFKGGGKSPSRSTRPIEPPETRRLSGLFEDVEDKVSKSSKEFLSSIEKSGILGQKGIESFRKNLETLSVTLDETGTFTKSTDRRVKELILSAMNADSAINKTNKHLTEFKVVLGAVGEYLGEIKNSGEEFLRSLGVDFAKIIPEQFKAAFRLASTVIMAPFKTLAKVLGFKKKSEETKRLDKIVTILNKLSSRVGGPGTRTRNLFTVSEETAQNTKVKEKKGIFGMLAGLFAGLIPVVEGVIAALLSIPAVFVAIAAVTGIVKGVTKSWEVIKDIFSRLGNIFTNLVKTVGNIVGIVFPDLGKTILGFVDGLQKMSIVDIFNRISLAFEHGVMDLIAIVDRVVIAFDHVFSDLADLGQWAKKIIPGFVSSFFGPKENKNIVPNTATLPADNKDLKTGIDTVADKTDDLRDSLVKTSSDHNKNLKEQIKLQQQTNTHLDNLIDLIAAQKPNTVPPQIRANIDGRRMGIFFDQMSNEAEGAGRTATGT